MTFLLAAIGSLAIVTLLLLGQAILNCVERVPWSAKWPGHLALTHLIGSAAMAWFITLTGIATGRLALLPVYLLLAVLVGLSWHLQKGQPFFRNSSQAGDLPPERGRTYWKAFLIAGVAIGVASTAWDLTGRPVMTSDAYWNWAIKAKALFLAGSLHPILANCCLKPNYPILFGLQSWWVYQHLHHVSDRWPQIISFLFYLDILAIAYSACRTAMRSSWAWMAVALLANDTAQTFFAPRAQPDSAVSAFFLASSIFLARYFAHRREADKLPAMLMLLGAMQTKNEGLVWTMIAVALIAVAEIRWRHYLRAMATVALFLIAAVPWTYFKHRHHMTYGPEELMATGAMLRLEWALRLKQILVAHLRDLRPVGFVSLMLLCLPMIVRRWPTMSKPVLALIGLQFGAYLAIYFIVADPEYQLHFTNRAISQIAPALVCTCLMGYFHKATESPAHPN